MTENCHYTLEATRHANFDFDPATWVVWANSQFDTVFFPFLFLRQVLCRTVCRIWNNEGSKRVVPRKGVPFVGLNKVCLNFGGKSPNNWNFGGMSRTFKPKRQKKSNPYNLKIPMHQIWWEDVPRPCGDDHVTNSQNRKLIRVTSSNECREDKCVDVRA